MNKDDAAGRGTTLQDDLLEDLRLATPAEVPLPPTPAAATEADRDVTPTFEMRVTPLRWSWPSVQRGRGLEVTLSAGPVHISVRGFGR